MLDNPAIKCTLMKKNTLSEIQSGNLGSILVSIRGLGQTILYLKKDIKGPHAFARYQTWISEETEKTYYFFRFKPSEYLENYVLHKWQDLMVNGEELDLSYMKVWSMSEEDYLPLGQKMNEKLGIKDVEFIPKKDISSSMIGFLNVYTDFGEIINIKVGINEDKNKNKSFFLMDPSFYNVEKNINFSKFKLFPELKIFLCRFLQYYYNIGEIKFVNVVNIPDLESLFEGEQII